MNQRNKPCACGSGKKTKKCCGSEAAKSQRYQEYLTKLRTPPVQPESQADGDTPQSRLSRSCAAHTKAALVVAACASLANHDRY